LPGQSSAGGGGGPVCILDGVETDCATALNTISPGDSSPLGLLEIPTGTHWELAPCTGGEGCVRGWTEIEVFDYANFDLTSLFASGDPRNQGPGSPSNPCAGHRPPTVFPNYMVQPSSPYQDGSKNAVQHIAKQHINDPLNPKKSTYITDMPGGWVGTFQAVVALNAETFMNPDKPVATIGEFYVFQHTFYEGQTLDTALGSFTVGGTIGDLRRGGGPTLTNTLWMGKDCFTVRTSYPGTTKEDVVEYLRIGVWQPSPIFVLCDPAIAWKCERKPPRASGASLVSLFC